jgi:hypothetical protein
MIDVKIDRSEKYSKRGGFPMSEILERDRAGKCEGVWEDRLRDGDAEHQAKINGESFDSPESFPNGPWANSRNPGKEQPGVFGGHV